MTGPRACPACESAREFVFVEARRDPVGGVDYRLYRCGTCALVSSDPNEPVGPEWYEKAAPLRAKETRGTASSDWRFLKFLDSGIVPGRVLDVGCGDGGFLALAAARGWRGVGVDYESRMIALARAKGLDAHAQDYAAFLKGRPAKEFDAAVLFDVLEHTPDPRGLLALIKPVLKRGGRLAVTFPNDSRPGLFGREEYDYPPHHFTRWNTRSLRSFLEREGFVVETLETVGPSVRWFSEVMFFRLIAPSAVGLARRVLFGAKTGGTVTELYAAGGGAAAPAAGGLKGFLSDKARRQALADAVKYAFRIVTYPLGALLALAYRLRRDSGEYLYCVARYEG